MRIPDEETVQVPASLLSSLLTNVNDLRDSVSQLKNENDALKQELNVVKWDLTILQQNIGVRFPQFTKLPLELRRMVWQFACLFPQTIIVSRDGASRSKINSIVDSCKEARDVASTLKLDYYLAGTDKENYDADDLAHTGLLKNYMNLHVDTVWLTKEEESIILPENIAWVCGKCLREMKICRRFDVDREVPYGYDGYKIRSLAVNYSTWLDFGHMFVMGSMELFMRYEVEEALLVVGNFKAFEEERDSDFVTPPQLPMHTAHALSKNQQESSSAFLITWQELEENMHQYMQDYKDNRAKARQERVDSGQATFTALNGGDREELWDLSGWKIPKVRFVEVRKKTEDWVLTPSSRRLYV